MAKKKWMRLFYFLVIAGMVFGSLAPLSTTAQVPAPTDSTLTLSPGGTGVTVDPFSKLDSELRALAAEGGDQAVDVYILAKEGADLSRVAAVTETRPFPDGAELVVASVMPAQIEKLATHPGVLAAEAFHAIEAPSPITPKEEAERLTVEQARALRESVLENLEPRELPDNFGPAESSQITATSDWNGASLIGAPEAWAKGYTGEGVNIAILDSGVDFGHPDLMANIAFYEDGPYEGWPIALDPYSMRQYYYHGYDSWTNYNSWGNYSWYGRATDVIDCAEGEVSFDLGGYMYTISEDLVAMSQSGQIRWGVHPDIQFPYYVYWHWVPFILIDADEAGVYNTVIADLNFDYWFDEYDDTAVLGTDDPVLSQDLGSYVYTDTEVGPGTAYVPAGFWWYPPLWYGYELTTDPVTVLPAGTFIYAYRHDSPDTATDGADGIPEVSGGMVYYVSDGVKPVPGMDYLYPGSAPALNGQLVAFMLGSDFAGGGDHGTLCASAAVAGGQIKGYFGMFGEFVQYETEDWSNFFVADELSEWLPWLKGADEGTVQGAAPGAKIIAIGDNYGVVNNMQGFYDAYTFLAYGVDGQPNSGDEFVDLASMSYGDGSVHNDGWDWESRLISYYNQQYLPNTTFFASSGNGGPGFGTVNSPQGNTVVTVGASTQYGASTAFGSAVAAEQINEGDVVHFSGRGPDALGRPDPDVLATGGWGAGNSALNMSAIYNYYYSGGWFPGDGNNAWYEWGGTSRSAPEAAGVMATIYQAYMDANGVFPDFETARQILMSGAQDLEHDVLRQGAGRVNADTGTDIAAGLGGVYVAPSMLAAGEYKGTQYESFGNILFPGDTWTQTFTVTNPGAAAATVSLGDETMVELETLTFEQVVKPYLGTEGPYPATYYYWADYFVGADPSTTTHGEDLAISVPDGADFMEVELTVPFELFDFCYNDPDPYSICYGGQHRWSLTVFDWTDRNENGVLWEDVDGDGVVGLFGGDVIEVSATGAVTETELNRFNYAYNHANVQSATVRLGDRDDIDNIVIGLVHNQPNVARGGEEYYLANPLQVKVVFYEKVDWPIVATSAASVTVPAGSTATFNATFTIPNDASLYGLHEGAITVGDAIVPVTVNVAVPSDEMLFTLGGNEDSGAPYDNSRMGAGFTWSGVYEEGDWRFYYYDAETGLDQQYLYVRNQWGDTCGNMPTFNETLVWGPNHGDQFSLLEPEKYGPYGMQFAGGTDYTNTPNPFGWGGPRVWAGWHNGDGIAQPESRAWATLWDGLNQVQFRNVLMSGKHHCGEGFEATAGVFGVDVPETGVTINTDQLSGTFNLDAISPVDGLIAYAAGFGEKQWFRNQDVPQGKHTGQIWPDDLMSGWVHTFEVENSWGIEAETFGPWTSDVDLYLLFDANNDGLFNIYDNREALAYSRNSGPFDSISFGGLMDGTYALVMYGYWVTPGDQFDLQMQLYGGDKLNVEGANSANNYVMDVTAGDLQNLVVNWEVPKKGVWQGMLWFGMPWEENQGYYSMGPSFYVPVTINAGGILLGRSDKTVDKEIAIASSSADDAQVLTYQITLVNDGTENAWVQMTDLLPEGTVFHEQFVQDPDQPPGQGWWYVAKWWYDFGPIEYFWPGDYCPFYESDYSYLCWNGTVGPSTSGKVHIEYQVKVLPGYVGTITNKADFSVNWGNYHEFFARTATTEALRGIFMPATFK
jgi:uncharacterized repeat protein (TIGR01451 family)